MWSRRRFLSTSIVCLSSLSSGCLGYRVVRDSKLESRDNDVDGGGSINDSTESQIERIRSESEDLSAENEQLKREIESIEEELEQQRRQGTELEEERNDLELELVVSRYRYGYVLAEHGTQEYQNGVDEWNGSAFIPAMRAFERANSFFRAAREAFNDSLNLADAKGMESVARHGKDAMTYCDLMADVCDSMGSASEYVYRRETTTAEDHYSEAIEVLNSAREVQIADPSTIEEST